jgi:hypothetical protein
LCINGSEAYQTAELPQMMIPHAVREQIITECSDIIENDRQQSVMVVPVGDCTHNVK